MPPKGNNTSSSIRKWSIPQSEIKKIAKELTKVPEIIEEVQAPAIEQVAPWSYEVYAWYIQAHIDEHETYTESVETLKKLFPQTKHVKNIAQNLKRTYGINYRYSDLWEYVFFDGETKDETVDRLSKQKNNIIVQLTSAETKVINQQHHINVQRGVVNDLMDENSQLKSDLYNTEDQRNQSLLLAILLFIYILISNYYG